MDVKEAAARCLEDGEFAQKVLTGEEDYPAVRDAILADLYAELGEEETEAPEVSGFNLNGQFIGLNSNIRAVDPVQPVAACYVRYYPKGGITDWSMVNKINVLRLSQSV